MYLKTFIINFLNLTFHPFLSLCQLHFSLNVKSLLLFYRRNKEAIKKLNMNDDADLKEKKTFPQLLCASLNKERIESTFLYCYGCI